MLKDYAIDYDVTSNDIKAIFELVAATSVFTDDEVRVAAELVEERVTGKDMDYQFVLARDENSLPIGYSCYGIIPLTDHSYDLYWIVVSPQYQGKGLAKHIYSETEKLIKDQGGNSIYIDTSSIDKYVPARKFYEKSGFLLAASFKDFYRKGDDKIIYEKRLV